METRTLRRKVCGNCRCDLSSYYETISLKRCYDQRTLSFFVTDVLPSFCDMGNAISSLIGQGGVEGAGLDEDGEENVLLSEEHSLVLTCCWVSLKVKLLIYKNKRTSAFILFHIILLKIDQKEDKYYVPFFNVSKH